MSKETLEDLKAIIACAPPRDTATDFTQSFGRVKYYRFTNISGWHYFEGNNWIPIERPQLATRSLSDIERIIKLIEDESRLDHLQKCNEIFNVRAGSNYGWKVDWNHNRIAIVDTGMRGVTIREAIDNHIKKVGDL